MMAVQPKPQSRPVRRYDVDGNEIRTGAAIIGARARNGYQPPGDERIDELKSHIAERSALDNSEKDLTAAFKDAEAAITGGSDARPLDAAANGIDQAILQANANAAEHVANSKLTRAELQAKATAIALADVLTERGLVSEQGSPEVDEPDLTEDDEPDFEVLADGEYGQAEDGTLMQVVDGRWAPVDLSADADLGEEDPPDQWRDDGLSSNEQFIDLTGDDDGDDDAA
jgi:hypothetical protein